MTKNGKEDGNGDTYVDESLFQKEPLVHIEIDNTIYTIPTAVNDLIDNLALQIKELQILAGSGGFQSN